MVLEITGSSPKSSWGKKRKEVFIFCLCCIKCKVLFCCVKAGSKDWVHFTRLSEKRITSSASDRRIQGPLWPFCETKIQCNLWVHLSLEYRCVTGMSHATLFPLRSTLHFKTFSLFLKNSFTQNIIQVITLVTCVLVQISIHWGNSSICIVSVPPLIGNHIDRVCSEFCLITISVLFATIDAHTATFFLWSTSLRGLTGF